MAGTFDKPEIVQEELDVLLIGGGMACCGTAYEIMRWAEALKAETGKELKIKLGEPSTGWIFSTICGRYKVPPLAIAAINRATCNGVT